MPLPYFLLLLGAVIVAALLTIWVAAVAGLPLPVLAIAALALAGLVHYAARTGDDPSHN